MTRITNEDMYKNQYDCETLKKNIYAVSLLDILKTQTLTEEFCIKYILNEDFQFTEEEQNINVFLIQKYQPHINILSLLDYFLKQTNINKSLERNNSFDDFETYSTRN
jgi:hypothetical protein